MILEKGRFISPWKHILVDEFQDISPQRAALLEALRKQNSQTTLFAVGDDWQAIYRFSGAQLSLTTAFHQTFGEGEHCHWTPRTALTVGLAILPIALYSRIRTSLKTVK